MTVGGALTEIVYRIGAGALLVGTDTTSVFPEAAGSLPKVGYQRALSAEGVLSLRPTVVLASPDAGPAAAIAQLQAAGVRLVRTDAGHHFGALLNSVRTVAAALQRSDDGARLATELQTRWQAVRSRIDGGHGPNAASGPRVLFILSHTGNNVQVSGRDTAADAMIRLAGAHNAMSGFAGYRPMSAEAVIAAAPDAILSTGQGIAALGGLDALLRRPGLGLTPAGRHRRVVTMDALYLLGFGPRLPEAVAELAARLERA